MNREADMRNEVRTLAHTRGEALVMELHEHYCARTGFEITLTTDRVRMWNEWLGFKMPPFTKDDLSLVINYLRGEIRQTNWQKPTRNIGALKFLNLIGQVDKFEEDLALARRARKSSTVQRTGTTAASAVQPEETDPRTAAERLSDWRKQMAEPAAAAPYRNANT